jgi:vacuolar protein sorting-associated protein 16
MLIIKNVFLLVNGSCEQWNSGTLLRVGWSCCEDLVCVQDDGSVLIYDLFGNFKKTFTMGQVITDM